MASGAIIQVLHDRSEQVIRLNHRHGEDIGDLAQIRDALCIQQSTSVISHMPCLTVPAPQCRRVHPVKRLRRNILKRRVVLAREDILPVDCQVAGWLIVITVRIEGQGNALIEKGGSREPP